MAARALIGAHTALAEEHVAFSILSSGGLVESLPDYQALVLAEQCILSAHECDAIRRFVERGGALLATGDTTHIICGSNGRPKSLPPKYRDVLVELQVPTPDRSDA